MKKKIIIQKNYDILLQQPIPSNLYDKTFLKILTDPYLLIFNTLPKRMEKLFPIKPMQRK